MEVLISIVFMICKLIKICMLIIFAQEAFKEAPQKEMHALPLVAIVFNLSIVLFGGIVDAFSWLLVYKYFLIFPIFILPLVLFIVSKRRKKT